MVNTPMLTVALAASVAREAPEVLQIREIADADLELLAPASAPFPSGVRRLRDSHHALARALAGGMSNVDASRVTGYAPGYISILRSDPAFKELVSFYRSNLDLVHVDLHERMVNISMGFAAELQDRLENEPDKMSNGFVLDALVKLADRTGHSPIQRSVNVNVDLAGRLEAARRRVEAIAASSPEAAGDVMAPAAEEAA